MLSGEHGPPPLLASPNVPYQRKIAGALLVLLVASFAVVPAAIRELETKSALAASYAGDDRASRDALVEIYDLLSGIGFLRATADRIARAGATDAERLEMLLTWTQDNVRPSFAAPYRVVSDTPFGVVRRGFGYCDQMAHVFVSMLSYMGYEGHMLFLQRVEGDSPHSVAEVKVGDRWIVADPWLGILWKDASGQLIGTAELKSDPDILRRLGYPSWLTVEDFERAVPFRTFPYIRPWDLPAKLVARILSSREAQDGGNPPTLPAPETGAPSVIVAPATIVEYDRGRRSHLAGRLAEAVEDYRRVLSQTDDGEISRSSAFFLGLALLRVGTPRDAVDAFDRELSKHPDTPWRASVLYYRAEAKEQLGLVPSAVDDLRASGIPSASARLAALLANR